MALKRFTRRQWLAAGRFCEKRAARERRPYPYHELHIDPATKLLQSLSLPELALLAYFGAEGAPL